MTNSFTKLVNDYIQKDSFFDSRGGSSWDNAAWEEIFKAKQHFFTAEKRQLLIEVITTQYEALQLQINTTSYVKLQETNTFTVCCAHQPNLLGGPMYTVVKIASTIALARRLSKQFPQYNFIPIYYIGSEDHDFQELNNLFINNDKIEWAGEAKGAFGSLSCVDCQSSVDAVLEKTSHLEFGQPLQQIIKAAYNAENTLAEASFSLMHQFLSETELLIIDANNTRLKDSFKAIMQREIFETCSYNALSNTMEEWEQKYPRALEYRTINLFYLDSTKRTRIVRNEDGNYSTADNSEHWNAKELQSLLEVHPERFSPNAVLRPVYQEFILPNIAFVGGGGEIAYWKQVYSVFSAYAVPYPTVHLRNSMAFSDKKMEKRTEQLGYTYEKWFSSEESLLQEIVANSGIEWTKETSLLHAFTATLEAKSAAIDKGLEGATGAAVAQMNKAMEGLEKKWTQAIKRKEEDQINAIKKGKQQLFPNGILQERRESFLPFYAKYGPTLIDTIINQFITTDSSQFLVLNPEADA